MSLRGKPQVLLEIVLVTRFYRVFCIFPLFPRVSRVRFSQLSDVPTIEKILTRWKSQVRILYAPQ